MDSTATATSASSSLLHAVGTRGALGKVAVPIQPALSIHARFDHFVAAPALGSGASEGGGGGGTMTVNKLRIWDRLVESLLSASTTKIEARPSIDRVDAAIETARSLLQRRGLLPESGTFLNVFA